MSSRNGFSFVRAIFGFRVLKTVVATVAAIYTATLFGIPQPFGAGLLAILGVETTRLRGIKTVFARTASSILSLVIASFLFHVFGFHLGVLAAYIMISFPLLARIGLKDGIVTGAVIVFHLYAKATVNAEVILTEVKLLFIGLGWATAVNLAYFPKEEKTLEQLRLVTETSFAGILTALSRHLRHPDLEWDGDELFKATEAVDSGIEAAQRSKENRLIHHNNSWLLYFRMRQEQLDSFQMMVESVAHINRKVPQADLLANLFDQMALDVRSEFYEGETERMLQRLENSFPSMALPATRDEFETRAALFLLSRELQRCLKIAKREKRRKSSSAQPVIQ